MICVRHREGGSTHFSLRARRVRVGASKPEAATVALLRECRCSRLVAIPVVQLALGLDTRACLLDSPTNGKKGPLQGAQKFVCGAVILSAGRSRQVCAGILFE